jgi:hypothetical protein
MALHLETSTCAGFSAASLFSQRKDAPEPAERARKMRLGAPPLATSSSRLQDCATGARL